jgi:hypothetical protein
MPSVRHQHGIAGKRWFVADSPLHCRHVVSSFRELSGSLRSPNASASVTFPAGFTRGHATASWWDYGSRGSTPHREGTFPWYQSPARFHNSSTRRFTSGAISMTPGQGLVNPSPGHFRVASIPIFDP